MACIGLTVRLNGMHWIGREVKWHALDWLAVSGIHWFGREIIWHALDWL